MSRTFMAVLALTAAAACAVAATVPSSAAGPSPSAIVAHVDDRLAEASVAVAAPSVTVPAPALEPAHYAAPAHAASADLTCEIRATPTSHGVELTALAHSSAPTSGTYDLVITKSGGDGSSDITQAGEFDTASGPSAELGTAEISLERGAHFRARLVVHGGSDTCRDELSS